MFTTITFNEHLNKYKIRYDLFNKRYLLEIDGNIYRLYRKKANDNEKNDNTEVIAVKIEYSSYSRNQLPINFYPFVSEVENFVNEVAGLTDDAEVDDAEFDDAEVDDAEVADAEVDDTKVDDAKYGNNTVQEIQSRLSFYESDGEDEKLVKIGSLGYSSVAIAKADPGPKASNTSSEPAPTKVDPDPKASNTSSEPAPTKADTDPKEPNTSPEPAPTKVDPDSQAPEVPPESRVSSGEDAHVTHPQGDKDSNIGRLHAMFHGHRDVSFIDGNGKVMHSDHAVKKKTLPKTDDVPARDKKFQALNGHWDSIISNFYELLAIKPVDISDEGKKLFQESVSRIAAAFIFANAKTPNNAAFQAFRTEDDVIFLTEVIGELFHKAFVDLELRNKICDDRGRIKFNETLISCVRVISHEVQARLVLADSSLREQPGTEEEKEKAVSARKNILSATRHMMSEDNKLSVDDYIVDVSGSEAEDHDKEGDLPIYSMQEKIPFSRYAREMCSFNTNASKSQRSESITRSIGHLRELQALKSFNELVDVNDTKKGGSFLHKRQKFIDSIKDGTALCIAEYVEFANKDGYRNLGYSEHIIPLKPACLTAIIYQYLSENNDNLHDSCFDPSHQNPSMHYCISFVNAYISFAAERTGALTRGIMISDNPTKEAEISVESIFDFHDSYCEVYAQAKEGLVKSVDEGVSQKMNDDEHARALVKTKVDSKLSDIITNDLFVLLREKEFIDNVAKAMQNDTSVKSAEISSLLDNEGDGLRAYIAGKVMDNIALCLFNGVKECSAQFMNEVDQDVVKAQNGQPLSCTAEHNNRVSGYLELFTRQIEEDRKGERIDIDIEEKKMMNQIAISVAQEIRHRNGNAGSWDGAESEQNMQFTKIISEYVRRSTSLLMLCPDDRLRNELSNAERQIRKEIKDDYKSSDECANNSRYKNFSRKLDGDLGSAGVDRGARFESTQKEAVAALNTELGYKNNGLPKFEIHNMESVIDAVQEYHEGCIIADYKDHATALKNHDALSHKKNVIKSKERHLALLKKEIDRYMHNYAPDFKVSDPNHGGGDIIARNILKLSFADSWNIILPLPLPTSIYTTAAMVKSDVDPSVVYVDSDALNKKKVQTLEEYVQSTFGAKDPGYVKQFKTLKYFTDLRQSIVKHDRENPCEFTGRYDSIKDLQDHKDAIDARSRRVYALDNMIAMMSPAVLGKLVNMDGFVENALFNGLFAPDNESDLSNMLVVDGRLTRVNMGEVARSQKRCSEQGLLLMNVLLCNSHQLDSDKAKAFKSVMSLCSDNKSLRSLLCGFCLNMKLGASPGDDNIQLHSLVHSFKNRMEGTCFVGDRLKTIKKAKSRVSCSEDTVLFTNFSAVGCNTTQERRDNIFEPTFYRGHGDLGMPYYSEEEWKEDQYQSCVARYIKYYLIPPSREVFFGKEETEDDHLKVTDIKLPPDSVPKNFIKIPYNVTKNLASLQPKDIAVQRNREETGSAKYAFDSSEITGEVNSERMRNLYLYNNRVEFGSVEGLNHAEFSKHVAVANSVIGKSLRSGKIVDSALDFANEYKLPIAYNLRDRAITMKGALRRYAARGKFFDRMSIALRIIEFVLALSLVMYTITLLVKAVDQITKATTISKALIGKSVAMLLGALIFLIFFGAEIVCLVKTRDLIISPMIPMPGNGEGHIGGLIKSKLLSRSRRKASEKDRSKLTSASVLENEEGLPGNHSVALLKKFIRNMHIESFDNQALDARLDNVSRFLIELISNIIPSGGISVEVFINVHLSKAKVMGIAEDAIQNMIAEAKLQMRASQYMKCAEGIYIAMREIDAKSQGKLDLRVNDALISSIAAYMFDNKESFFKADGSSIKQMAKDALDRFKKGANDSTKESENKLESSVTKEEEEDKEREGEEETQEELEEGIKESIRSFIMYISDSSADQGSPAKYPATVMDFINNVVFEFSTKNTDSGRQQLGLKIMGLIGSLHQDVKKLTNVDEYVQCTFDVMYFIKGLSDKSYLAEVKVDTAMIKDIVGYLNKNKERFRDLEGVEDSKEQIQEMAKEASSHFLEMAKARKPGKPEPAVVETEKLKTRDVSTKSITESMTYMHNKLTAQGREDVYPATVVWFFMDLVDNFIKIDGEIAGGVDEDKKRNMELIFKRALQLDSSANIDGYVQHIVGLVDAMQDLSAPDGLIHIDVDQDMVNDIAGYISDHRDDFLGLEGVEDSREQIQEMAEEASSHFLGMAEARKPGKPEPAVVRKVKAEEPEADDFTDSLASVMERVHTKFPKEAKLDHCIKTLGIFLNNLISNVAPDSLHNLIMPIVESKIAKMLAEVKEHIQLGQYRACATKLKEEIASISQMATRMGVKIDDAIIPSIVNYLDKNMDNLFVLGSATNEGTEKINQMASEVLSCDTLAVEGVGAGAKTALSIVEVPPTIEVSKGTSPPPSPPPPPVAPDTSKLSSSKKQGVTKVEEKKITVGDLTEKLEGLTAQCLSNMKKASKGTSPPSPPSPPLPPPSPVAPVKAKQESGVDSKPSAEVKDDDSELAYVSACAKKVKILQKFLIEHAVTLGDLRTNDYRSFNRRLTSAFLAFKDFLDDGDYCACLSRLAGAILTIEHEISSAMNTESETIEAEEGKGVETSTGLMGVISYYMKDIMNSDVSVDEFEQTLAEVEFYTHLISKNFMVGSKSTTLNFSELIADISTNQGSQTEVILAAICDGYLAKHGTEASMSREDLLAELHSVLPEIGAFIERSRAEKVKQDTALSSSDMPQDELRYDYIKGHDLREVKDNRKKFAQYISICSLKLESLCDILADHFVILGQLTYDKKWAFGKECCSMKDRMLKAIEEDEDAIPVDRVLALVVSTISSLHNKVRKRCKNVGEEANSDKDVADLMGIMGIVSYYVRDIMNDNMSLKQFRDSLREVRCCGNLKDGSFAIVDVYNQSEPQTVGMSTNKGERMGSIMDNACSNFEFASDELSDSERAKLFQSFTSLLSKALGITKEKFLEVTQEQDLATSAKKAPPVPEANKGTSPCVPLAIKGAEAVAPTTKVPPVSETNKGTSPLPSAEEEETSLPSPQMKDSVGQELDPSPSPQQQGGGKSVNT